MPDRILRANILTSDAVNTLTWPAEVFYRRLMSVVDDFGRFDGRASLLRGSLYPLKLDKVSESDIVKWLGECQKTGLVRFYEVDGKPYLEVQKFGQRLRLMKSKYPSADMCGQMTAYVDKREHLPPETKRNDSETENDAEVAKSQPISLAKSFSDEELMAFKNFQEWIKVNAPRVSQMKEPFTIEQYLSLKQKGYDAAKIRELLANMHNWADLLKKKVSAYLTLLNWKRREEK